MTDAGRSYDVLPLAQAFSKGVCLQVWGALEDYFC
ncbi:MAG: hypothetical protein LZF60_280066 [Nitrospira sp.]|nr:MAG: hypothetical protein LZF60_280066 [Nitrospira sp.]